MYISKNKESVHVIEGECNFFFFFGLACFTRTTYTRWVGSTLPKWACNCLFTWAHGLAVGPQYDPPLVTMVGTHRPSS